MGLPEDVAVDRRILEDRRVECANHGNMCMMIGEIRAAVEELDAKISNMLSQLEPVLRAHQSEQSVDAWKLKMIKRGGVILGALASLATLAYYIGKWASGK